MSFSTLTPLTLSEFEAHCRAAKTWNGKPPRATCAHHTYSPTSAQWQGLSSMRAIRSYHMGERGYSDIAANFYVGPDSRIWTARPLDRSNWAHAYVEKTWANVHESARAFANGDRLALNRYAVGIEIVGNFDTEDPGASASMALAIKAFAVMHRLWSIPLTNLVFFHRMVADKSCPGSKVALEWFRAQVAAAMGAPVAEPNAVTVLMPNSDEVACKARLEDGRTVGQFVPVLEALHIPYRWVPPRTLKIGG